MEMKLAAASTLAFRWPLPHPPLPPSSCHVICWKDRRRPFFGTGMARSSSFDNLRNYHSTGASSDRLRPFRRTNTAAISDAFFDYERVGFFQKLQHVVADDNSKLNSSSFSPSSSTSCCSAKKAFSSMVFIIRELQSYTLQLREIVFYEDQQGIVARVHTDIHDSFCWLFHHIFSCTPTLMLSIMLLLANFAVYSMGAHHNLLAVADPTPPSAIHIVESLHSHPTTGDRDDQNQQQQRPSMETFSVGRGRTTASVWGGGGGGRKVKLISSGATDDGRPPPSSTEQRYLHLQTGQMPSLEQEAREWKRTVEEATRMTAETRHEALMDHETLLRFVSPITLEVEPDGKYSEMEAMYEAAVEGDPHNSLFLSNYAQFLYQVVHDHHRAEQYFKRAVEVKPADAEALSRYANFLWLAKNDLEAAEETYLEAIAADPGNTLHAANYAHFLWNTGGEDTCFPLDDDDGGNNDFFGDA